MGGGGLTSLYEHWTLPSVEPDKSIEKSLNRTVPRSVATSGTNGPATRRHTAVGRILRLKMPKVCETAVSHHVRREASQIVIRTWQQSVSDGGSVDYSYTPLDYTQCCTNSTMSNRLGGPLTYVLISGNNKLHADSKWENQTNILKLSPWFIYHQFNTQRFWVLSAQWSCVGCMDLNTNSD